MAISAKGIVLIATGVVSFIGSACVLWKISSDEKASESINDIADEKNNDTTPKDDYNEGIELDIASAQTEAEFINTINSIRLNQLLKRLSEIKHNQMGAEAEIEKLKAEIDKIIDSNRGGKCGMHGFIGESCQVHIANIKSFIQGEKPLYVLRDDNSMTDYVRGMQLIQQKACQSDNHLGLDHIRNHIDKYPVFLERDGIYQIPKDFYHKYTQMKNTPENIAMKFRKEDLRLWKTIRKFVSENPNVTIEPMEVTYSEIQAGNVGNTIAGVEKNTHEEFRLQKEKVNAEYAPSVKEMLQISSVSGVIEGTVEAAFSFGSFIIEGKRIQDFDEEDRKYIIKHFATGFLRGYLRAGIVYGLTTLCKLSSNVATSITTAMFSFAKELNDYAKKKISKMQFIKNTAWNMAEIVLGALGAYIGKKVIKKNSIVGSLIGSLVFTYGLRFAKKAVYA